jgi:hypothetical protein
MKNQYQNLTSGNLSNRNDSNPDEYKSLADQYLDTMTIDDDWRRLMEYIRDMMSQHTCSGSSTISPTLHNPPSNRRFKTGPLKPRTCRNRGKYQPGSDNEFISLSSSPNPRLYEHSRSTGNSIHQTRVTTLINVSGSDGACFSCKSTSTTCWRYISDRRACNPCALR